MIAGQPRNGPEAGAALGRKTPRSKVERSPRGRWTRVQPVRPVRCTFTTKGLTEDRTPSREPQLRHISLSGVEDTYQWPSNEPSVTKSGGRTHEERGWHPSSTTPDRWQGCPRGRDTHRSTKATLSASIPRKGDERKMETDRFCRTFSRKSCTNVALKGNSPSKASANPINVNPCAYRTSNCAIASWMKQATGTY